MANNKNQHKGPKTLLSASVSAQKNEPGLINVSTDDARHFGIESEGDFAYVSMKYYQKSFECLGDWTAKEVSGFSRFCTTLQQMKWTDIEQSGGKGGSKTGLGYTQFKNKSNLPNQGRVSGVEDTATIFELRVSKKARVFGFRCRSAFKLIWLDRNHNISG